MLPTFCRCYNYECVLSACCSAFGWDVTIYETLCSSNFYCKRMTFKFCPEILSQYIDSGQITAIRQPKVYQKPFYDLISIQSSKHNQQYQQAGKLRRQNVKIGHKPTTRRVLRPLRQRGSRTEPNQSWFPNRTNDRLMVSHRLHARYLYQVWNVR